MTRVATFAQSQFLFNELQRLRVQANSTQAQIASGKKAQTYQEIAGDTGVLVGARSLDAQTEQFREQIVSVQNRLDIQDIHLTQVSEAAAELHKSVLDAIAVDNADGLMTTVKSIFEQTAALMNSKFDGEYLYSGSLTDTASVSGTNISDLTSAVAASDLFQNNQLTKSVRIDTNLTVQVGILVEDIVGPLFDRLKAIADFDAGGSGPLTGKLTQAQQAFLTGELAALSQTAKDTIAVTGDNGRRIAETKDALERHEATDVFVKSLISDIEDVDIAEAITRLNADQVAIEATLSLLAQLSDLSLLDFLR